MASSQSFLEFVYEQTSNLENTRHKKMFGEYMFYYLDKPVFLICDDTVFVKQLKETLELFQKHNKKTETGTPYDGAKEHFVLDIEDADLVHDMAVLLAEILPLPKSKSRK